MACAASLHPPSSSSSRALFPTLCRRSTFPAIFHRLRGLSSTSPLVSTVNRLIPVRAQARRGFSVKEDEVASGTDGIGLSAPQVGINVQLMVFNPVVECGEGKEIVLVNPRVTRYSQKTRHFNEGCLSFPGIYADVVRPETVKIDAQDIKGAKFTVSLSGVPARVFQHEFDHLKGVLFFDRMSDGVLETICAQLQALEKKYEDRTGLPSPERVETHRRMKAATGFGKSQLV